MNLFGVALNLLIVGCGQDVDSAGETTTALEMAERIDGSCGLRLNKFNAHRLGTLDWKYDADAEALVFLDAGDLSGYGKVAWAEIQGSRGMRVWLDWSDEPGRWHQCGPFTIDGSQGPFNRYTWAIDQHDPKRYFRACGDLGAGMGGAKCTSWHHATEHPL